MPKVGKKMFPYTAKGKKAAKKMKKMVKGKKKGKKNKPLYTVKGADVIPSARMKKAMGVS